MTYPRIITLLFGLLLAATTRAELPPSLDQAATQVANVPAQRQALAADLEDALKAGVTEPDLQSLMRLATTQKYSAANAAAFVKQLAVLRRSGLPVTLLRDKILEGMAKKVPAEAILTVAGQWQGALKDSAATVRAIEGRGLKLGQTGEREALINLGAGLRQRYGATEALSSLAESAKQGGRLSSGAGSLIAAGNLTEQLLLQRLAPTQALELPQASLKAGYTPEQIQALQRTVADQLRQGVAPADIVSGMRRQLGSEASDKQAKPAFTPAQPFGNGPSPGAPGGGFPSGPGGSVPGAPGGGFPSGPSGGGPAGGFPSGGGR